MVPRGESIRHYWPFFLPSLLPQGPDCPLIDSGVTPVGPPSLT
jgi:hypothetical protein